MARPGQEVLTSGLRSRDGGRFSAAPRAPGGRRAQAGGRRERLRGDPDSRNDQVLLSRSPHLMFEGIAPARRATSVTEAVLCVHEGSPLLTGLRHALAARPESAWSRCPGSTSSALVGSWEAAASSRP
jgi:hypothetical protein